MTQAAACLSDYIEAVARRSKCEPPAGYGYKADLELGVGFLRYERNGCKVLEKPVIIPSGAPHFQGYSVFYAYCSKDGVESMLQGQCPPILPATRREPSDFASLADIAANFGAKDPHSSAAAGGCDFCVPLRVPSEIANQAETSGRDIWMVQFNLDKVSPFLQAAKEGNTADVEKAIKAGMAAQTVDEDGVSSLMMAVMGGNVDTSRVLLAKNVEVDYAEPHSGRTALMFAAQGSNAQLVEMLLAAKADPAKVDKEATSALMWAAVAGRLDNAKLLGAVCGQDKKNKEGLNAKAIAEKMGHAEVAAVLA